MMLSKVKYGTGKESVYPEQSSVWAQDATVNGNPAQIKYLKDKYFFLIPMNQTEKTGKVQQKMIRCLFLN
jgi:hypothetical protein